MFIGIRNPDALNIRIFKPIIALPMLYSMRTDCKTARTPVVTNDFKVPKDPKNLKSH